MRQRTLVMSVLGACTAVAVAIAGVLPAGAKTAVVEFKAGAATEAPKYSVTAWVLTLKPLTSGPDVYKGTFRVDVKASATMPADMGPLRFLMRGLQPSLQMAGPHGCVIFKDELESCDRVAPGPGQTRTYEFHYTMIGSTFRPDPNVGASGPTLEMFNLTHFPAPHGRPSVIKRIIVQVQRPVPLVQGGGDRPRVEAPPAR